ncbi:MAG: single-stranded DNA-binding protein [Actinobacteria bacterium]|nr:single-stranded DNA-binding protein [Actinomycetota bacterium]
MNAFLPDVNRVFLRGILMETPVRALSVTGKPFTQFRLELESKGPRSNQKNCPLVRAWGKTGEMMAEARPGELVEVKRGLIREVSRETNEAQPKPGFICYVEAEHAEVLPPASVNHINDIMLTGTVVHRGVLLLTKGKGIPHITLIVSVNGPKRDDLVHVPVVLWGSRAKAINEKLGERSALMVETGKLRTRTYKQGATGEKGTTFEVVAHDIHLPTEHMSPGKPAEEEAAGE